MYLLPSIILAEPTIVGYMRENFLGAELFPCIWPKQETVGCVEAARERVMVNWAARYPHRIFKSVPLNTEIKTAIFLAKAKNGEEIFVAAHIPADKDLGSTGMLKKAIAANGIELVGKLERDMALPRLNSALQKVLDKWRGWDEEALSELEKIEERIAHDALESFRQVKAALEKHIDDPTIKSGMLNPWTLYFYACAHSDCKKTGDKPIRIVHLVDKELAERETASTTNAGTKYHSIIVPNTSLGFEYLKGATSSLENSTYIVYDAITHRKQAQQISL